MDIDWLKDMLALAEHGNFSRAAEVRHVTQPAFSRRIRALEAWLGTPLFLRGAQGATLTPAGLQFRPAAEDMLRALDRARRDARAIGVGRMDSLSIAATHALSFSFFPGWIRRHVSLESIGALNLISDSMEACEQILFSGEVHFLLCHHHAAAPARFDPARFASVCLGHDRLVPLCAPGGHGGRLLGYGPTSGLGRILATQPAFTAELETVFTSQLAATLMTMAREGHGVAWLPLTLAEEDLATGRLVRAGAEALDIALEIRLFRSPDCRGPAADRLWGLLA